MRGPSGSISDQNKISVTYLSGGRVENGSLTGLSNPFFIDPLTPVVLSSTDGRLFMMNIVGDGAAFPHGYAPKFLFVASGDANVTTNY